MLLLGNTPPAGLAIGDAPRETANGKGSAPPPAPAPPPSDLAQPQPQAQQGGGGDDKDGKSARKQLPDRAIYHPPAPAPRSAAEGETSASGSHICHLCLQKVSLHFLGHACPHICAFIWT